MSKADDRAALAALLANGNTPVTILAGKPMEHALSASALIRRSIPRGEIEKDQTPVKPRKRVKRNWRLQREYDALHGTVNGGDARIDAWNEFHRNERDC